MTLPYTLQENIWTDKAATATAALMDSFVRCPTKVIEVITTGFSGTLDIQGKIAPAAAHDNVVYTLMGQAGAQTLAIAQLSYTTNTSRFRYLVTEPYAHMQLVMTRSAGSVTVNVFGWGLGISR